MSNKVTGKRSTFNPEIKPIEGKLILVIDLSKNSSYLTNDSLAPDDLATDINAEFLEKWEEEERIKTWEWIY